MELPVLQLRALHFRKGPIDLRTSPHYSFVRSVVEEHPAHDDYLAYIVDQFGYDAATASARLESFVSLIEAYRRGGSCFSVRVRIGGDRSVRIVDGFHRAAIVAACDPDTLIECQVLL